MKRLPSLIAFSGSNLPTPVSKTTLIPLNIVSTSAWILALILDISFDNSLSTSLARTSISASILATFDLSCFIFDAAFLEINSFTISSSASVVSVGFIRIGIGSLLLKIELKPPEPPVLKSLILLLKLYFLAFSSAFSQTNLTLVQSPNSTSSFISHSCPILSISSVEISLKIPVIEIGNESF